MSRPRPFRDVLVVEEDTSLREAIKDDLARQGIGVRATGRAEDAIASALERAPDLLVLDLDLPDRTGWDVVRALYRRGLEVPTIVLCDLLVSDERLSEFHPIACLPKPFPLESLLRLVMRGSAPRVHDRVRVFSGGG